MADWKCKYRERYDEFPRDLPLVVNTQNWWKQEKLYFLLIAKCSIGKAFKYPSVVLLILLPFSNKKLLLLHLLSFLLNYF